MSRYAETDSQRYLWHLQQVRRKKRARRREDVEPPVATDPDAIAYIAAVEAADDQPLEAAVQIAIDAFVIGCKADGVWDAIKASCIMAGSRTLPGALVPLKGASPTNFNFVPTDYDRVTGLKGDGATKYLDSNRNNNADPQNNHHLAAFASSTTEETSAFSGARSSNINSTGSKFIGHTETSGLFRSVPSSNVSFSPSFRPLSGLVGISRAASSSHVARLNNADFSNNQQSSVPNNLNIFVFSQSVAGTSQNETSARLSFYSIGEAIDLEALDNRVTALMTAIDEALS